METTDNPTPEFPPRSGKGSGTAEWLAFAQDHGIDVADDADRDTIIAAVDAVFGDPAGPEPETTATLSAGHGRTFEVTPSGATLTYTLLDGTKVRVWQFPPPRPRDIPTLDESSVDGIDSWRFRVLSPNGAGTGKPVNPDRTYTTAEVNALLDALAGSSS